MSTAYYMCNKLRLPSVAVDITGGAHCCVGSTAVNRPQGAAPHCRSSRSVGAGELGVVPADRAERMELHGDPLGYLSTYGFSGLLR